MTQQSKAGVALGVFAGLVLGTLVGLGLRVAGRLEAETARRRAWPLMPTSVARRDLAVGEVLSLDDVGLKSIPERFVTAGSIKAQDTSYVIDQVLWAPVMAGQPLEWAFFDEASPAQREPVARAACEEALTARLGPFQPETLEQIRTRVTRGRR